MVLSLYNIALNNADCNVGQIDFEAVQNEVEATIQSKKKRGYMLFTDLKSVSRSASMQQKMEH